MLKMTPATDSGSMPCAQQDQCVLWRLPTELIELILQYIAPIEGTFGPSQPVNEFSLSHNPILENYGPSKWTATERYHISGKALINFSSTCTYFRQRFAPRIFKHITCQLDEKSFASLHALSETRNWRYVQSLTFHGFAYHLEARSNDPTRTDFGLDALQSLFAHPPPALMSVGFDLHPLPRINMADHFRNTWTRTVQDCLKTVSRSKASLDRALDLTIYNLNHYSGAVFDDAEIQQWLNRLNAFNLSFAEMDHRISTVDRVLVNRNRFAESTIALHIGHFFLDHLQNITSLNLHGDVGWSLGEYIQTSKFTLPLRTDHMPKLEHVSLRNLVITPHLTRFLTSHGATLQSIQLLDCSVRPTEPFSWADFFDALSATPWRSLSKVTILYPGFEAPKKRPPVVINDDNSNYYCYYDITSPPEEGKGEGEYEGDCCVTSDQRSVEERAGAIAKSSRRQLAEISSFPATSTLEKKKKRQNLWFRVRNIQPITLEAYTSSSNDAAWQRLVDVLLDTTNDSRTNTRRSGRAFSCPTF